MQLFILVVQRRGHVEVALHVGCCVTRLFISILTATFGQILAQPTKQRQCALHSAMAGLQHAKRLIEACGGRGM